MRDEIDRRFAAKIKTALDEDLSHIDRGTLMRLRAARRAALETKPVSRHLTPAWYLPAAAAAGVLAVALYLLWSQDPPTGAMIATGFDDAEVQFPSSDRLDLYRDLDFYRWLAANDHRS